MEHETMSGNETQEPKIQLGMIVGRGRTDEAIRCIVSLEEDIDMAVVIFSGWGEDDITADMQGFFDRLTEACPSLKEKVAVGMGCKHLTSFADERNKTVHATTETHWWFLWADSDDMLLSPGSLRKAAQEAEQAGANIVEITYVTDGNKGGMIRERLVRSHLFAAGHARWHLPLHEYIQIDPPHGKAIHGGDIQWHHMPSASTREDSRTRNRAILSAALEGTDLNLFHMAMEFHIAGDVPAFRRYARRALDFPSLGDNFRYHLLRLLGEHADTVNEAIDLYSQAVGICPYFREAYADLIEVELRRTSPCKDRLTALVAAMLAHKPHRTGPHTNPYRDPAIYGWKALDYAERVARYTSGENPYQGKRNSGRVKILLSHATYNRGMKCVQTREKWLNYAEHPERVIHVFGIEDGDKTTEITTRGMARVVVDQKANVAAFNSACEHEEAADCQIILQLSDDTDCFPGWDTALEQRLDVSKPQVLRTSDGCRDDWLMTMPVITRKRYEEQGGWLLHPDYQGMYSDTDFSVRAMYDKAIVDARDLVFQHLHPMFGHGVADHTYAHNNDIERYRTGFETFQRLCGFMVESLGLNVPAPQLQQPQAT